MRPMRVLVVDDYRDSADMLAAVLMIRDAHLRVDAAYDGSSGLAQALTGKFEVIILDLMLPGLSGAEVAQAIRVRLANNAPVLIALSGSLAEVALHKGGTLFDHALTKPVNVNRLMGILTRPP